MRAQYSSHLIGLNLHLVIVPHPCKPIWSIDLHRTHAESAPSSRQRVQSPFPDMTGQLLSLGIQIVEHHSPGWPALAVVILQNAIDFEAQVQVQGSRCHICRVHVQCGAQDFPLFFGNI